MSLLKAKLDYLRKEKIKFEQQLQKLEKEAQGYQEQNSALLDQIYDATVPLRT
jgi:prefoldin subunit 5